MTEKTYGNAADSVLQALTHGLARAKSYEIRESTYSNVDSDGGYRASAVLTVDGVDYKVRVEQLSEGE